MEDSDSLLLDIVSDPGTWIYVESNESKTSLEDEIKSGGEYVIYGSKEYVKNYAKILEKRIGEV